MREIEERLGYVPAPLRAAGTHAEAAAAYWHLARAGYWDSPLPPRLRERICARLSRNCAVRYALLTHVCAWHELGVDGSEIFAQLREPAPTGEADAQVAIARLAAQPGPLEDWPSGELEDDLLCCTELAWLFPAIAEPARVEVRRVLGAGRYEAWTALLLYLRVCHGWTDAHPQVSAESEPHVRREMPRLLAEEPRLNGFFEHYAEAIPRGGSGLRERLVLETTRRKRAVAELDRFFMLSVDLFCIVGFDGHLRRFNPAWEKATGFSRAELLATPLLELTHPEERAGTEEQVRRLCAGGTVSSFQARLRTRDGGWRWFLWSAGPSLEDQLFYAVGHDVTDRRAADEMLQAKVAAEEANRAKSRFLANVSHELRTPLNAVIGFANVLLKNREGHFDAQDLQYADRIRDNGSRLLNLIERILDLSRIEAGRAEVSASSVSLDALVRDMIELFRVPAQARGVEFAAEIPEGLAPLETDPVKSRQVLLHLLDHALKTSERGRILVRVLPAEGAGAPVRPAAIEVVHPAAQIPRDRRSTLFDPFRNPSTDTLPGLGPGLELTLARALCTLLGYRIDARSADEGVVYRIDLVRP